jgi:urease accessory protein
MDPCVPFQNSAFQQSLNVSLEPNSSCVLIDWFSAGRLARGEFWDFMSLASRTSLYNQGDNYPFLVESMFLNNELSYSSMDPFGFQRQWNAYASVLLHGPQAEPVARRLQDLSLKVTSDYTRVRTMQGLDSSGNDFIVAPQTSGRVLVGVSEIDTHESTFVARVATTCNEDLYRILHACLQPLSPKFGFEFYKDRIHASQTSLPQKSTSFASEASSTKLQGIHTDNASLQSPDSNETTSKLNMSSGSLWNAFMLADSGLPTGSFAHSAGIEAAAQLAMFQEQHALQDYIQAAIRSSLQLQVPFLLQDYKSIQDWSKCDKQLNAYMVSNSVACRASLEQGQGLLRVALSWLHERQAKVDTTGENYAHYISLLQAIQEATTLDDNQGHLAPIFAIVCLSLHVSPKEAYQLLGYCTARDMVSAAVRLNLIGPMAGVSLLDSCWNAVHEGIESARTAHLMNDCDDEHDNGMVHASTCAPIVETIHPCHDILSVRLFRT